MAVTYNDIVMETAVVCTACPGNQSQSTNCHRIKSVPLSVIFATLVHALAMATMRVAFISLSASNCSRALNEGEVKLGRCSKIE